MDITACPPIHWIPVKLAEVDGKPAVRWLYLDANRFTQPFFSDTIQACRSLSQNASFHKIASPLEPLPEWSTEFEAVSPDMFIFHISRCGSTLVSQILSLLPENIVVSEAPLLDEILRLPYHSLWKKEFAGNDEYFKATLRFYGRMRSGAEKKLIIKTDSWHLMFYQQLRTLYPHARFVVIIRSPDEVVRSQHKLRGMHSVPGIIEPELLGIAADKSSNDFDVYMARVLECYFTMILKMKDDPLCRIVDYNKGMEDMMQTVLTDLGIQPSDDFNDKMKERLRFHGKIPNELFKEERSMPAASAYLLRCFDLYLQLGGVNSEERLAHPG
jgi:hypothetical protein